MSDDASSWEKERLAALLDAAKTAISRSRFVFAGINIATIIMLSAEFNGSITWLRKMLARAIAANDSDLTKMLKEVIEKDLGVVSVPLVGIKFSASDTTVLGAISMVILAIWMFFATRRENHVVTKIIQEAKLASEDSSKALYLYDALAHNFVFLTATRNDIPGGERPSATLRATVRFLLFAPCWVLIIVALTDTAFLFMPASLQVKNEIYLWGALDFWGRLEVILRIVFCIIIAVWVFIICRYTARFQSDTVRQLEDTRNQVDPTSAVSS